MVLPHRTLGNRDIAAVLEHIADLLEVQGANVFRVRAYRNAARTLAMQARSVVTSTSGGGGASRAGPYTSVTDSTRYTSEPRSRNTPVMPLCEAMPASLAFMHSNRGPESSVRR